MNRNISKAKDSRSSKLRTELFIALDNPENSNLHIHETSSNSHIVFRKPVLNTKISTSLLTVLIVFHRIGVHPKGSVSGLSSSVKLHPQL